VEIDLNRITFSNVIVKIKRGTFLLIDNVECMQVWCVINCIWQVELWKEPSVIGGQVDMRVAPASTTSLLQMLTDAGIPHHIIADDLHRFSYTSCTRVAIQNTVRVTAILVSDSLSFRLSVCLSVTIKHNN